VKTRAKQRGKHSKLGLRGQTFVKARLEEMGFEVTPTGDAPSIDLYVMLHDGVTNLHFNVQVKTGKSFLRPETSPRHYSIKLDERDVADWKHSGSPTFVVWVDNRSGSNDRVWTAYWATATNARGNTLKIRKTSRLDMGALRRLERTVRQYRGRHGVVVTSEPLFPARVSDIKWSAWEYFKNWKQRGTLSPFFGAVAVTMRSWRHLTRVSRPQREVIHKLSLLPCAREIIEKVSVPEFRRSISGPHGQRKLYALSGRHEPRYRGSLAIEVIIEVFSHRNAPKRVNFLSVYEKRSAEAGEDF
jgi:hypothetical protein